MAAGVYCLKAHKYVDALLQTVAEARAAQGKKTRAAYVGCGIQRLGGAVGLDVENIDIHTYGAADVIVQSLDGDVRLGSEDYDFILLAQASGTLCSATAAARNMIKALRPGGTLIFAFVANSLTATTNATAAALSEADRLQLGELVDFASLHVKHPVLHPLASDLALYGFTKSLEPAATTWSSVRPATMDMVASAPGKGHRLTVHKSAMAHRSQ